MSKGAAHGGNHRVDPEDAGPVDRPSSPSPAAAPVGRLTVDQAAAFYQTTESALYEFIRRRPWLPGIVRLGRSIRIDVPRFEAGLKQQELRRNSRLKRRHAMRLVTRA